MASSRVPSVREMIFTSHSGPLKKTRHADWRYQQTFLTPLPQLEAYVAAIGEAHGGFLAARLTVEQIVFDADNLARFTAASRTGEVVEGCSIDTKGQDETLGCLKAAFGDWIDFLFVPNPARFAIYADHDEFTTFLSDSKADVDCVRDLLKAKGFRHMEGYQRPS
jgi:hypothetical protein